MEWRPRRNHPCQILCQSVKGFLGGSAPKMAISYTFLNDPYNSTALPCRLWSPLSSVDDQKLAKNCTAYATTANHLANARVHQNTTLIDTTAALCTCKIFKCCRLYNLHVNIVFCSRKPENDNQLSMSRHGSMSGRTLDDISCHTTETTSC